MRDLFIEHSIARIRKQFKEYDEDKIAEIKYGLEGLYIMVTKTIIIFGIAIILNIWKELLLLLLFFNLLRMPGFGLHAKSSGKCLISSTTIFIGLALLSKYISIPFLIRLIVAIFCTVNFCLYAPADTEKRPLINKKKRCIYKVIIVIIALIYTILQFIIKDSLILNILVFSMAIECVLINPLSYRFLGLRYDNYKYYQGNNN